MRYMKVKVFAISVLILIAGIALTSLPRVTAQREHRPSEVEQKLLDVAARRQGLNATRLQLLKSTTVELPLTGRRVQIAKVLNTDNGQAFPASIDEQSQEVEFSTLKAEEQRAYRARYGKLTRSCTIRSKQLAAMRRSRLRSGSILLKTSTHKIRVTVAQILAVRKSMLYLRSVWTR